jgi:tRNA(Ile2) C34 agmatinyltransferase TiaS
LESEAKRRRTVEGKLAELDEKDKCVVCLAAQPNVLFLRCRHLACCSRCADSLQAKGAVGAKCPQCRKQLRAKDIVKVYRA